MVLAMALGDDAAAQKPAPSPGALQKADAAFRAGYAAMQAGRLEEARKDFANTVALAPRLPEAHSALGAILVQLSHPREAVPELEKALQLKPGDATAAVNLALAHEAIGKKLVAQGNAADAERQIHAAIAALAMIKSDAQGQGSIAAQDAEFHDELGSLLAQQKRWDQAETAFREALKRAPQDEAASAHMHLGVVLVEEKQYSDGLKELSKAAEIAPGSGMAQFQLGHGLTVAGQDEEALPHLEEALKLAPALPGAALELAMTQQRLGRQAESISNFEKALAQEPHNAQALTNLGLALTETGKAQEAMPYLERSLAETPNDPVVHEDLGVAQLQQSHFDEAIAQFQKAGELDSANPQLHYDLGLAYKLKDRIDDAVRELSQAASLDPTLPDAPYTLGILYMQLGRQEDAAKQLRAALALRPANGDGWAILGSVLKQMDKRDEAEDALKKAIALLPNQPGPHITLAAILAEEGKHDEAAAERKLAAGLSRNAVNRQRAMLNTNAGNQLLQRGQIADAVEQYIEAIAADPGYAEAHAQLAVAYARQGRAEDAAAERQKADSITKAN
jgi:tetratricopeptide (TPR) repeat protein